MKPIRQLNKGHEYCQELEKNRTVHWAVTVHKSQGLTLERIRLGLGKREFSTGLTFVALSRVKALDCIMVVDHVDYSRVQKLGGKHMQHRFDDYACRYNV
jgi:hypothetical protein